MSRASGEQELTRRVGARRNVNERVGQLGLLLALLVATISAAVFFPTLSFDFVMFDDDINIYRNEHLGALTEDRVKWMFSDLVYVRRYIPVGWLGFGLIFHFGGLDPIYYHGANVLLHAANTGLLFVLCRRLITSIASDASLKRILWCSFLAALWWALHPLRVEVVAWSSGFLYNFATLWVLLGWILYLKAYGSTDQMRGRLILTVSSVAFSLSLLSYPAMAGGVFCIIGWEVYHLQRAGRASRGGLVSSWPAAAKRILCWVVPATVIAYVSMLAAMQGGEFWKAEYQATLGEKILTTPHYLLHYVRAIVAPLGLQVVYDTYISPDLSSTAFLAPAAVLMAFSIILVYRLKHGAGLFCFSLAFFGMLLPTAPVFAQVGFTSDRYSHGAAAIAAAVAAVVLASARGPQSKWIVGSAAAVALLWLPVTFSRLEIWRNTESLTKAALSELDDRTYLRTSMLKRLCDYRIHYLCDGLGALEAIRTYSPSNAEAAAPVLQRISASQGCIPKVSSELYRLAIKQDIPRKDLQSARARLLAALRWAPGFTPARATLVDVRAALRAPVR